MKRKNEKIDIMDFNRKIIKEKLKNSLYVLSDLDKELLSIPQYQSSHKRKEKEIMNITEDYVSFEIAKLLKEKGFEGYSILTIYDRNAENAYIKELREKHLPFSSDDPKFKEFYYTVPTLQMAMKWLREVHKIVISIFPTIETDMIVREDYNYTIYKNRTAIYQNCSLTYEDAVEAAIKYCLEILI